MVERLAEREEHARSNVAVDDAKRPERQEGDAVRAVESWGWLAASWLTSGKSDGSAEPGLAATMARAHEAGADRWMSSTRSDDPLERLDENPTYPGSSYESTRVVEFLWDDVVFSALRGRVASIGTSVR